MFPLFSVVDHQPLCFKFMFGNTCSLHLFFVSRNPTTTHCNNMFCSALFCIIRRPAAFMFQMFSPASSLYASSHSVCFLSVLPLSLRFKMFSGRPAAFIRFKCFQVDQQPLCVCFLPFVFPVHLFPFSITISLCFLSSLPSFFFFFDWWTSSVSSVQFS